MRTVEANYYLASTLLNISFYYIYLSCRGKRSVWHSCRKVPSFETFCDRFRLFEGIPWLKGIANESFLFKL